MNTTVKPGCLYALCGTDREAFARAAGLFCPAPADYLPEKTAAANMRLFAALFPGFSEKQCRLLLDKLEIPVQTVLDAPSRTLTLLALCTAREGTSVCYLDLIDVLSPEARNKAFSLFYDDPFRSGRTILLATDEVSLLTGVCDRVLVVRGENVLADFSPETCGRDYTQAIVNGAVPPEVSGADCVLGVRAIGRLTELSLALPSDKARAFLIKAGIGACSLSPMSPEQVVAQIMKGGLPQ